MVPFKFGAFLLPVWSLVAVLGAVAMADAPSGHFVASPEVVVDSATHLTWQRVASDQTFSQMDAEEHCANLSLAGGGWRLPTLKELHTLVDETRVRPALDPKVFPNTQSAHFWTSSRLITFPKYAWAVSFEDGTDFWFTRDKPQHVRCVRSVD